MNNLIEKEECPFETPSLTLGPFSFGGAKESNVVKPPLAAGAAISPGGGEKIYPYVFIF